MVSSLHLNIVIGAFSDLFLKASCAWNVAKLVFSTLHQLDRHALDRAQARLDEICFLVLQTKVPHVVLEAASDAKLSVELERFDRALHAHHIRGEKASRIAVVLKQVAGLSFANIFLVLLPIRRVDNIYVLIAEDRVGILVLLHSCLAGCNIEARGEKDNLFKLVFESLLFGREAIEYLRGALTVTHIGHFLVTALLGNLVEHGGHVPSAHLIEREVVLLEVLLRVQRTESSVVSVGVVRVHVGVRRASVVAHPHVVALVSESQEGRHFLAALRLTHTGPREPHPRIHGQTVLEKH